MKTSLRLYTYLTSYNTLALAKIIIIVLKYLSLEKASFNYTGKIKENVRN